MTPDVSNKVNGAGCGWMNENDNRRSKFFVFSKDGSLFAWCNGETCPSWSDDESISVRTVNNELHFFENNSFDIIASKLHLQKVTDFVLSPGSQPCKVAVYVPGVKGGPSFVRLYQYPNFAGPTSALANKSFFKADRVTMLWNKKATAVLVTASTEVDKTGASYYGEQTLHYIATNGEGAVVQLPKNGPIYDVVWSPNSTEFCVVYGFMPAKETKPDDIQEKVLQSQPKPVSPTAPAAAISGDPELDKKIKNLKKKIKAIEQLKDQQAAGKPLEKNQDFDLQKA
ncbi:UNVERIFIED_CONTAM: hypothetical protein FKN15_004551 [Acipenser sinensis]